MYYIELDLENNCTGNFSEDIYQDSFIKTIEVEKLDKQTLKDLSTFKYVNGRFIQNEDAVKRIEALNKIEELENYLSETDWMAIRYADEGTEIPEDVKAKRHEARGEISRLRELI